MSIRRIIPVGFLTMMAVALPLRAQSAVPTKVAVANTIAIFGQIQEVKDLNVKLNNDQRTLQAEADRRKADLENLMNTRNQFKPESQQWSEANQKYIKAAVDFRSWGELTQIDQLHQAKLQTKQVFDEIQAEATDMAKQMGYDLVISQQAPDLAGTIDDPQVTIQQFRSEIAQFNVLYAGPTVDISDKIVTALDAKYKNSGASPVAPAK
jgi:Skp family chaperone for outer membrane proteins